MATTHFVNKETLTDAAWFNDVDYLRYDSQDANKFWASPSNAAGSPSFRTIAAADITSAIASLPSASGFYQWLQFAVTNQTETITAGPAKFTTRVPACTIKVARASLVTASSSGVVTVDINDDGTSIFSTPITIDANEKTSVTAATPAVISNATIGDDSEITIDIDTAGTSAAGLLVTLLVQWA